MVSADGARNQMGDAEVVQATFDFADGEFAYYSVDLSREEELGPGWRDVVTQAVEGFIVSPEGGGATVIVHRWLAPVWDEDVEPDWFADTGGRFTASVTVSIEPNEAPVAVATADPVEVAPGEPITFSATDSFDPNDDPLTYFWEFSDGETAEGIEVEHAFDEPGQQGAMLTVEDDRYEYGEAFAWVLVKSANEPPVAALSVEPEVVALGQEVTFHTTGTSDPDDDALTYTLVFGDETAPATGTLLPPYADLAVKHTYEAPGEYTARLTVSDGQADPVSATRTVTVVGVRFDRDPIIVGVAKTETVTATVIPDDYYGDITFSVADAAIASVEPQVADGEVQELTIKGLKKGVTILEARFNDVLCGQTLIKIGKPDFVRITPDPGILTPGERTTFTAVGFATVGEHPPLPSGYSPELSTPIGTVVSVGNTRGVFLGPVPVTWKIGGPKEPREGKAEAFIPAGVPTENVPSVEIEAALHAEGNIRPDLFCDGMQDKADLLMSVAAEFVPGVTMKYTRVPVASNASQKNREFQCRFSVFLGKAHSKTVADNVSFKVYYPGTNQEVSRQEAAFLNIRASNGMPMIHGKMSAYANGYLYVRKADLYEVEISDGGQVIDGRILVDAVGAHLSFPVDGPIPFDILGEEYAVLPVAAYKDEKSKIPDEPLKTTASLVPVGPGAEESIVSFELKKGAKHTISFGAFVKVAPGDPPETQVSLDATAEGEGPLVVSLTSGVYLLEAIEATRKVNEDGSFTAWASSTRMKKGSISPLTMICPDIDIKTPDGDPTRRFGRECANADNEPVFDDRTPAGEKPGQCLIKCEANPAKKLSEASQILVDNLLGWELPKVGSVAPVYSPEAGNGHEVNVTYGSMPAKMTHFGPKFVTLQIEDREDHWRYYQKIEMFFHTSGTANPGRTNPNWFYYWRQVSEPRAGAGNTAGVNFTRGAKWTWAHHPTHAGQSTVTTPPAVPNLASFVAMVAHEQKHETDFYEVIWQRRGYKRAEDGDRDDIRNNWETVAGRWKRAGDYTDDKGGFGNLSKNEEFYFDTTTADFAWSDVRADAAAAQAIKNDPSINLQDWSDLGVIAVDTHVFQSDKGSPDPKRFVFKASTDAGNNKHYHP